MDLGVLGGPLSNLWARVAASKTGERNPDGHESQEAPQQEVLTVLCRDRHRGLPSALGPF